MISWNGRGRAYFGWRSAEAIERATIALLGPAAQDPIEAQAMLDGQDEWYGEVRTLDRLRTPCW